MQPIIAQTSTKFGIRQDWIARIISAESGGHAVLDGRPITSLASAMGLMQVMPGTHDDMRRRYGLGFDLYDPRDGIFAGATHLHELYARYGYPDLFAAYNAGPGHLDGYLLRG